MDILLGNNIWKILVSNKLSRLSALSSIWQNSPSSPLASHGEAVFRGEREGKGEGGFLTGKELTAKERVVLCVNAALEKKAKNLTILKVKELSAFTDYFVICSGASDRQVQALAAAIREKMKKSGVLPLGVEGESQGQWILMDYEDVVVHIFYEPVRAFYDIERLWFEAPQMAVGDDVAALTALDQGM